jgi:flagellar M-ring protein FliF
MVTASVFGAGSFDWISLVQTAILAAVALILGLFVIRPMLTHGPKQALLLSADQTPMALPAYGTPSPMVLTGEIDGFGDLPTVNLDSLGTDPPLDPVARLRRLIEERQAESVEILRGWMEQEEEKA